MLNELPPYSSPVTDMRLPTRQKLRQEMELPKRAWFAMLQWPWMTAKPRTEMEDPPLPLYNALNEPPYLEADLIESELPTLTHSTADNAIQEPVANKPRTLANVPTRITLLTDIVEPSCTCRKAEVLTLPISF
jgi:hypothetical protein